MNRSTSTFIIVFVIVFVIGVETWRAMNPAVVERRVFIDGTPYLDDGRGGELIFSSKLAEAAQKHAANGDFVNAGYLFLASGAMPTTTSSTRNASPTPEERAALMQFWQASLGNAFESFLAKKYPGWRDKDTTGIVKP